jgi:hypothetical protein
MDTSELWGFERRNLLDALRRDERHQRLLAVTGPQEERYIREIYAHTDRDLLDKLQPKRKS